MTDAFSDGTSGAALFLIAGAVAVAGGAVQVGVFGTDLSTTTDSDSLGQALNWCPSCGHIADGSWEFCEGCGTERPTEF